MSRGFTKFVEATDRAIVRIGHAVTFLFAVVVAISFFEVVMRYLFNSPTSWVHETTTFLVSISLIYGGVYCYASDRHIAMTFVVDSFSPRVRWFAGLLVHACTSVFVTLLLYGSYLSAWDAFFRPNGRFHMQTSGSAIDTPFPAINKGAFFASCIVLFVLVMLHFARHVALYKPMCDGVYVNPNAREDA